MNEFFFEQQENEKNKLFDMNFKFSDFVEEISNNNAIPIKEDFEPDYTKLEEGLKEITIEYPLSCSICQKTFKLKHHLRRHQVIHSNLKEFECKLCDKKFNQRSNLDTHIKNVHNKVKDYECPKCHKKFTQKGNLSKHMIIHEDNQPFQCEFCRKTFSQKNLLDSHLNLHNGEKPFECDICKKSFARQSTLYNHVKIHKKNENLQVNK